MDIQFRAQGGKPITPELAIDLRQLIFGTAAVPVRCEWATTALNFAPPGEEHAYGLVSPRNATRGLLSALQGFILKNLLFKRTLRGSGAPSAAELLRPNEAQQIDALITSMVEILAQISENNKFIVALPGEESFIAHSTTYFQDTITEKLYLFQLESKGSLEIFLKNNIQFFTAEDSPGALLFLYSAVLTRSIGKIRSDLDKKGAGTVSLVGNKEEGSLNIVTLLLTGRATPYIHNGVVHAGDENNYAAPQYGTLNRCSIGLLLWENEKKQTSVLQPGSRLKTPHLPIWITSCVGHFGVIFNNNQDLLRNYHAESRFELVYYSCSGNEVTMTIDNRGLTEFSATTANQAVESSSSLSGAAPAEVKEETINTPLQHLIHTKWEDASITFHCQTSVVRCLFTN
ncbi:inactive ubiquitin carboxyl-terminal hydrolase MINDY-4B [Episyrphus balteatus]|uniref:inactive ubiquitin carboxyl-terminal hydrolase MINDY-4B n=1 Tax=Episyrphus balteatus TaxID=286459 RepID=UPI0024853CFC|nr:inactive ubiquitin carboxyl-terminal hydrolase MINDY-4B [Episyrphus balteatus]